MDKPKLTDSIRLDLHDRVYAPWPGQRLSLGCVARESGVSKPTLSRFLRGHRVGSETLDRIASYLEGSNAGKE